MHLGIELAPAAVFGVAAGEFPERVLGRRPGLTFDQQTARRHRRGVTGVYDEIAPRRERQIDTEPTDQLVGHQRDQIGVPAEPGRMRREQLRSRQWPRPVLRNAPGPSPAAPPAQRESMPPDRCDRRRRPVRQCRPSPTPTLSPVGLPFSAREALDGPSSCTGGLPISPGRGSRGVLRVRVRPPGSPWPWRTRRLTVSSTVGQAVGGAVVRLCSAICRRRSPSVEISTNAFGHACVTVGEQALTSVGDELGDPGAAHRQHRQSGTSGLQRGDPERLEKRWCDEQIGLPVDRPAAGPGRPALPGRRSRPCRCGR